MAASVLGAAFLLVACGPGEDRPTMGSALEAVPLRLTGGQEIDVQLAGRQPATGACDPLQGERVRIRDDGLTVSVPDAVPALPAGAVKIVPHTDATYVVTGDGSAVAWLDQTLATGDEADVASFVGVDLSRTSPVAAARAVTALARRLDDAGAYAAVIRGPSGPPDDAGAAWTATGVTPDGELVHVRSTSAGAEATRTAAGSDPCAYRTAT